jgi:hypothetical protein
VAEARKVITAIPGVNAGAFGESSMKKLIAIAACFAASACSTLEERTVEYEQDAAAECASLSTSETPGIYDSCIRSWVTTKEIAHQLEVQGWMSGLSAITSGAAAFAGARYGR